MITGIKMEVTEELSERVQKIVFGNGGKWVTGEAEILTGERYLYLNEDRELLVGNKSSYFKAHKHKEVSAYDFIASQGEQGWLPNYGEVCEFSCDEDFQDVHTEKFASYMPRNDYCYLTTNEHVYKYCRPINLTKTITIKGKEIELSIEDLEDLKQQLKDD